MAPPPPPDWEVVLLVDHHERNNAQVMRRDELVARVNEAFHTQHQHRQHAHCEVGSARSQSLPAGDYMWVARRGDEERVLDCLVERKTMFDLGRCICNASKTYKPLTEMEVQMVKLRNCGIRNKIFLVENDPNPDTAKQGAHTFAKDLETLYPDEGFTLERSSSIHKSIEFLIRQHRHMLSGRPRFAREVSNTCLKIEKLVDKAFKNPYMWYYLELRQVDRVGDAKAMAVMHAYPSQETFELACSRGDHLQQKLASIETSGGRTLGQVSSQNLVQEFGGRPPHQRQLHVPNVTQHLVKFESPALKQMPANRAKKIPLHGIFPAGAGVETPCSRFPPHADFAVFDVANPVLSEMLENGLDDSMSPKRGQKMMGPTPAASEAIVLDSIVKSAGKRSTRKIPPGSEIINIDSDLERPERTHKMGPFPAAPDGKRSKRKIPHGAEIIQID
jgi:ERCC4-type nuclease